MTNEEFNEIFRNRTQQFAVNVLQFLQTIPFNTATRVMSFQLAKCATSVGANYRAFCRGRSKQEKFAKICIVVEEADECIYWLEIFKEMKIGEDAEIQSLLHEALEILKVTSKTKSSLAPSRNERN
jgi:four helix bundle protein